MSAATGHWGLFVTDYTVSGLQLSDLLQRCMFWHSCPKSVPSLPYSLSPHSERQHGCWEWQIEIVEYVLSIVCLLGEPVLVIWILRYGNRCQPYCRCSKFHCWWFESVLFQGFASHERFKIDLKVLWHVRHKPSLVPSNAEILWTLPT